MKVASLKGGNFDQLNACKFIYDDRSLLKENNSAQYIYVILLAGIHHASLEEEPSSMATSHLATAVDTQARNLYGGTCIMLFLC